MERKYIKVKRLISTTGDTKKYGYHRIAIDLIADWREWYDDKSEEESLTTISFTRPHPVLGKDKTVVVEPTAKQLDDLLTINK